MPGNSLAQLPHTLGPQLCSRPNTGRKVLIRDEESAWVGLILSGFSWKAASSQKPDLEPQRRCCGAGPNPTRSQVPLPTTCLTTGVSPCWRQDQASLATAKTSVSGVQPVWHSREGNRQQPWQVKKSTAENDPKAGPRAFSAKEKLWCQAKCPPWGVGHQDTRVHQPPGHPMRRCKAVHKQVFDRFPEDPRKWRRGNHRALPTTNIRTVECR